MSFKEVKELRISGKLSEALIIATGDLKNKPDDIWNKRSLAWVYYDYLKTYSSSENYEGFIEYLEKLKLLELPSTENMVFNSVAYQIGKLLFSISKEKKIDYDKINLIFKYIKDFHFSKPSDAYSFIYKAFHKFYKKWTNYISFADWWDFSNFSSNDYISEIFNGKKIISVVERAYIAYSKKLLKDELIKIDGLLLPKPIDKSKVKEFLPQLETIIKKHQGYEYLPYYKAKLLLSIGDKGKVLSDFIPFAKKERNEIWVWELLSEVFQPKDERKTACLCKALSLKAPDISLINTRQKLISLLINENKYKESKTEIQLIIKTCIENNLKIPDLVINWIKQDWYKNYKAEKNNIRFYNQFIKKAEEIIYADIPEEIVVIEFINKNKLIINFVKDKTKYGFFKYAGMIENPKIGDLLKVRFNGENHNGFYQILSIKKVTKDINCDLIKEFKGILKSNQTRISGSVDNVFINSKMIIKQKLKFNDLIEGKAVLSFNKKKNEWFWKAINIYSPIK